MQNLLRTLANGWKSDSMAGKLRRRRFEFFLRLISKVEPPVRILDVGGQENFWKGVGFAGGDSHKITLLNLGLEQTSLPNVRSVRGDARDLREFGDRSFDVVFSNSVIEHVGGLREQQRMANEIRRVGCRYFVQTPNRSFPMEPHFLLPLFQFLPTAVKAQLHHRLNLGWWPRQARYYEALAEVESIRLLRRGELLFLFPDAEIYEEKFAGLTKSFIAYAGWEGGGKVEGRKLRAE